MEFDVAFLDIGHGDCSVITFVDPVDSERRRCIVIDGGEEGTKGVSHLQPDAPAAAWRLAVYLKEREVRYIDLLIGTHIDSDHIGGLLTFLQEYTAKADDDASPFWNDRRVCIGQYWGPLSDSCWGRIDQEQGEDERKRYHELMQLLVKLKVKKKQTSQDQHEIARLEGEIARLRDAVNRLLSVHSTRAFVAQSVRQNSALDALVRQHVADPERDILAPDLLHPPPSPFPSVRIDLLWPDVQIPDSMIKAALFRPVDNAAPATGNRRPQNLAELLERVLDNQEALARTEDRKANNRSIVLSVRPTEWNGSEDTWPAVLLTGDAESESWQRMVPRYGGGELAAYILKVPHHGSAQNGITPEALRAIRPRFAIVSVGQIHSLPEALTLNRLRRETEVPLDIFCTERNHNPARQGPCLHTLPGCVRGRWEDYRGVVFGFDTDEGSVSVVALRFVKGEADYELEFHWVRDHESDPQRVLWCRQGQWNGG